MNMPPLNGKAGDQSVHNLALQTPGKSLLI